MTYSTDKTVQTSLDNGSPTLVVFSADWCPPCKALQPVIEQFSAAHTTINCFKVNVESSDMAAKANIANIPTIILYVEGKEVLRLVGLQTLAGLEKAVTNSMTRS